MGKHEPFGSCAHQNLHICEPAENLAATGEDDGRWQTSCAVFAQDCWLDHVRHDESTTGMMTQDCEAEDPLQDWVGLVPLDGGNMEAWISKAVE
jgi:hypothetical protein